MEGGGGRGEREGRLGEVEEKEEEGEVEKEYGIIGTSFI